MCFGFGLWLSTSVAGLFRSSPHFGSDFGNRLQAPLCFHIYMAHASAKGKVNLSLGNILEVNSSPALKTSLNDQNLKLKRLNHCDCSELRYETSSLASGLLKLPTERWFFSRLNWLDIRTASATLPPCKALLMRERNYYLELPQTHTKKDLIVFPSAATGFAFVRHFRL